MRPFVAGLSRDPLWRPIDPEGDLFCDWNVPMRIRPVEHDETLYHWRPTFWGRVLRRRQDRA